MRKNYRKRTRRLLAVVFIVVIGLLVSFPLYNAFAFQVPHLLPGNLISNPWFRSASNPTFSGLDGWTDGAGPNKYWSSSQKESNPSPDIIVSGVCGMEPVYCGTGARLSAMPGQSGGIGVPGVDAYLYQVVSSNNTNNKLYFFAHWVSHKIDPAEVTIYGGDSPLGPWTQVWTPFYYVDTVNGDPTDDDWTTTEFLETTISKGYPHYKVEIHARLPTSTGSGFKITGIYFSTGPLSGGDFPPPPNYRFFNFLPAVVLD